MNIGTTPYVSKPVANFGYRTFNTYEDNEKCNFCPGE